MTSPESNNTATQLQFRQGDATWDALRKRAVSDLYWFAENVLHYGTRIPMRIGPHALLCKFMERKTGVPALDEARYRKIEMPRETGKTTLSIARIIQRICADPNCSILLANEKEQNARDFLGEIKHQFESNEFLRALFPEVIPKDFNDTTWSASRIVVNRTTGRKEPTVSVIGVGGTVTGMHYTAIICDDVISREAMENARAGSRQIMEQVNRWIHQLEPLLDSNAEPFPEIIFIGTRWWFSDSYEHIEDAFGYGEPKRPFLLKLRLESGEMQHVTAWRRGDLAMFKRAAIEDGRSIFPEKWDLERLAKIRIRDAALFAANYMNDPSDDQTATFKESWLQYYDWLDDKTIRFTDGSGAKRTYAIQDLDILILVDPGGFAVRQVEDRANAAIIVTGTTPRGEHLIIEADSEKDTFLGAIRKILDKTAKYNPRRVYVEQAGQQAAFIELLRQNAREANLPMSLDIVKPGTQHKEVRILTLEPYFQRGQIFLGKAASFHQFLTQYRQFPRAARLDLLDALGYGPQVWRRQPTSKLDHSKRQQQEIESYYAKRGLQRR